MATLAVGLLLASWGHNTKEATPSTIVLPSTTAPPNMVPQVHYQSDGSSADARYEAMLAFVKHLPRFRVSATRPGGSEVSTSACYTSTAGDCANYLHTGADLGRPGDAITVADFIFSYDPVGFGNSYQVMVVPSTAEKLALLLTYAEGEGSGGGYSVLFEYLTPALLNAIKGIIPTDYFSNISPSLLAGNELDVGSVPIYETSTEEDIGIPADTATPTPPSGNSWDRPTASDHVGVPDCPTRLGNPCTDSGWSLEPAG